MKKRTKIDSVLMIIMVVYSLFGLIMIFSASSASTILRYHVASNHFFVRQLVALVLAYTAGIIVLKIPTKNYKLFTWPAILGIIFLLIYVLINGKVNHNAQSWLNIGPFSMQPSEFAKTILIIFMATFYNELSLKNEQKLTKYFIPVIITGIIAVLIAMEPDYGGAAILLLIAFFIFISVPFIRKNMMSVLKIGAIGVVIAIIGLFTVGGNILSGEKLSRFEFKSPCTRYQEDTGYQVCNGLIAIAGGGLFGKGIGKSTQKYMYLPESHTDFIFPIIVEELGSLVGILIIIGYGIMLYRLYKIAKESENLQLSIISYGAFWYFALHILINILGLLALIPLTGVPLPFLSYGGSYTINAVVMLFCVQRVYIENRKKKLAKLVAKM